MSGLSGGQGQGGGLAGLSVRRPWLAVVMNLLIVIAGLAALAGVEVRELPDTDGPVVSVRALYPGASPTTVDAEVTRIVEGAVARVSGVLEVSSSSEEGNFRMRLRFRPSVDLADAANDVREAVSRVTRQLPDGVERLRVTKSDADARPIMYIAAWSERGGLSDLTRRLEDAVLPELSAVPGVATVEMQGAREEVVRVELSPARLAAYGLAVNDVAEVLRAAQFDRPVGSFEGEAMEILVRADATVREPTAIEALRVAGPVRLGDVATVYFAPQEPDEISRWNGREVVTLEVIRKAQSSTVEISAGVERALARLEARLPGLRLAVTGDDAVFIESAIDAVISSLGLALLIVLAIIWLFLGNPGATLVPMVAIPVAVVGAIGGIWLLGLSINLVTLLAFVLAAGLVVDDAIVVLENIQRRRREMGPRAAALVGTREVVFAVIATTVTLVAVFLPIAFLPSEAGRLFREFGIVLALSVGLSSFVALTLAPMITVRLGSLGGERRGLAAWLGRRASAVYAGLLSAVLAVPLAVVTLFAILAAGSAAVYGEIGKELVPPEDRGLVLVGMTGPDGTGLDHTDIFVERAEELFQPWIEAGVVEGVSSITGLYDPNRGWIFARLAPWEERSVTEAEVAADIREGLAEMPGMRGGPRGGNTLGLRGSGGLRVAVLGPDYPALGEAAERFADLIEEELPRLTRVRASYRATQPQLSIAIDREAAAELDVPMESLAETLAALVDRDEVAELTIGDTAAPVMLRAEGGSVTDPADLLNLKVRSRGGALISLAQLVRLEEQGVAAELDREGQRRAVQISAGVPPDLPLAEVVADLRRLAEAHLPPEMSLLLLGQAAKLDETSSAVALTYALAVLVVFLVLIAQFESVTSALVVMLTVPFGIAAAVYALWLSGTTVNIYSQIGVLMLIGIMAKNGILLVEFADQLRDRGMSAVSAAREAALIRLRPIAMTLASTVLAGLPLILGDGAGSEARAAIGWVVVGGLGLAAALTLLLTPAVYALVAPLSRPRAAEAERLDRELAALAREG